MSQTIEIKVPDIGGFKGVAVIEIAVKAGDSVEKEQTLITLETDKATMDVPSPAAGVVKELKVKVGDKVSEGSLILMLESAGAALAGAAAAPLLSSIRIAEPSLTLSPTLTFSSFTTPAAGEGTSIVALSVSSVIRVCSFSTVSPGFTAISMTATPLNPPMSGTLISMVWLMLFSFFLDSDLPVAEHDVFL